MLIDSQDGILSYLLRHPKVADAWSNTSGKTVRRGYWVTMGRAGLPDIVGYLKDGRFFALEVKSAKDRPSEAQEEFLRRARDAGAIAGVVRTKAEVEALLG